MNKPLTALFQRHGNPFRLSPGTALFAEGDRCRQVGLIEKGLVRVYRSRPGDREGTLYELRPGELCLVSCLGALNDEPLVASATVDEEAAGWTIPAAVFRRVFASEESLSGVFLASLSGRLRAVLELLDGIQNLSVDERLASYLLDRARVRPGAAGEGRLETTHEKIAADLWTAREVVSRSLKAFEQRGGVRLERGSVVVVDPARMTGSSGGRGPESVS